SAHALGMQVIITDHHLTTKETPLAGAVVNPNQLGCEFPSKALAGVGVAFYVLSNLASLRNRQGKSTSKVLSIIHI
ncbi:DHH family phosphoesterase, partial [Acinetobacter baumannii]|uniref:DHH family phosphoesterase n=1 Tax=Acinetobacter baumannii TaxID=470 RepID=UPI000AE5A0FF